MFFSLDVRRARKGDCLLMHFGSRTEPGLVMIDGGPKSVYKPHLKPRLDEIRAARGLARQDALPVDLLMVSHVDDDHIQGILDLTKEELVAKAARQPRLLKVQSFWHNSFDEVIGHQPTELTASVKSQFGTAAVSGGGELADDKKAEVEESYLQANPDEEPEVVTSTLKVLASIEQGFRLRHDAEGLEYPRNPEFDGKLIMARAGGRPVAIAQGLELTVVGPMQAELAALHEKHQQWLETLKKQGKSPSDALAAYVDKSVPNLSSIVVVAEAGGKRMLLTGDARGDKIMEGLQLARLLDPGDESTIEVDLLKVPHHGSSNNLDNDFFKRIIARHYVFSGNGEHGNPERESLEMLFAARGDNDYTIHLTYPIDEIDRGRKEDWKKEQNKEKSRKTKSPNKKIRPNWSPAKQGLRAFFDGHAGLEDKVRIVPDTGAHVIDLLDPLGF